MSSGDLPEPDMDASWAFWAQFILLRHLGADVTPSDICTFGDSVAMADDLLDLVVDGPKRATAGALADYEAANESSPAVGDFTVVCDGRGAPRAIIETTEVHIGPLSSVDDRFAWDEGEGDRSRSYWLEAHTEFFRRRYDHLGLDFHDDIDVVFERFDLAFVDGAAEVANSETIREQLLDRVRTDWSRSGTKPVADSVSEHCGDAAREDTEP